MTTHRSRTRPAAAAGVRLLDAAPQLRAAIPEAEQPLAHRALVAPVVSLARGVVAADEIAARYPAFAWLLLDGLLLRRTWIGERVAAELVGPGDVLDLVGTDDGAASLPLRTDYVVHRSGTLAVLDARFRAAAQRWPQLHDVIHRQMAGQARRASRALAFLHLPRVEDRLVAVFSELADRWGRVTVDGVVLDLELTHSLLGELVGARRPTVSLALAELADAGTVVRRDDRSWLIEQRLLD